MTPRKVKFRHPLTWTVHQRMNMNQSKQRHKWGPVRPPPRGIHSWTLVWGPTVRVHMVGVEHMMGRGGGIMSVLLHRFVLKILRVSWRIQIRMQNMKTLSDL